MAIDTIKFKRGVKSKLNNLSYGEPAYISDENELYIGTEDGVEKITRNKEVAELSSQLEHNTNDLISIKNKQRIFKPFFGCNLSFAISWTYEQVESDETMKQRLQNIKNYGYDGYMLILEVQPNKSQRDGFIDGTIKESDLVFRPFPSIERVKWIIEEANKVGLKLLGIEVHCIWVKQNWSKFSDLVFSKMDIALLDIINSNIKCEFINLYNEANTTIFKDTTKHNYVINSLNLVRNAGYKTGIAGHIREGHKTIPSDLAAASDIISIHLYPSISNKAINTDINDGIRTFESHRYVELIEKLHFKHGKEIWITESGCQNYFEALSVPEAYYPQGTISDNNFVQCVYHKGMLEVFKNCSYLKGALVFYLDFSKEYPLLKGLYDYYLREDIYNV